jgi:enterobactin synthetase component D
MRLEPLQNPGTLPAFAVCYSARLIGGDYRWHFRAGRECAARALAQLGVPATEVGRGPAGEPLWPEGITGSITHKGEFVSAAVARASDALGIGIDAEEIVDSTRAARIAPMIVMPREVSIGGDSVSPGLRVSLLFSIKEAVFKCLYPLVGKRFYYDALTVLVVDLDAGSFEAELAIPLSAQLPAGHLLAGRVAQSHGLVHSGVCEGGA